MIYGPLRFSGVDTLGGGIMSLDPDKRLELSMMRALYSLSFILTCVNITTLSVSRKQ